MSNTIGSAARAHYEQPQFTAVKAPVTQPRLESDGVVRPASLAELRRFHAQVTKRNMPMVQHHITLEECLQRFPGFTLSGNPLKPLSWNGSSIAKDTKVNVWLKQTPSSVAQEITDLVEDGKILAIYPGPKYVDKCSAAKHSNAKDWEAWKDPSYLKMSNAKLLKKRMGTRYKEGFKASKQRVGDPKETGVSLGGILGGSFAMATSLFATIYILYYKFVPDMTIDTTPKLDEIEQTQQNVASPVLESAQKPGLYPQSASIGSQLGAPPSNPSMVLQA